MKKPEITLSKEVDGEVVSETYTAKPPKMKLWRKIVKFNQDFSTKDLHKDMDAYEAMLDLIAACYGQNEITPEAIEENLDLSELVPTLEEITTWVAEIMQGDENSKN